MLPHHRERSPVKGGFFLMMGKTELGGARRRGAKRRGAGAVKSWLQRVGLCVPIRWRLGWRGGLLGCRGLESGLDRPSAHIVEILTLVQLGFNVHLDSVDTTRCERVGDFNHVSEAGWRVDCLTFVHSLEDGCGAGPRLTRRVGTRFDSCVALIH